MTAEVDRNPTENPWPHRLTVATTAATFALILAGGIVTTTGAGLAVPDWPTTFGHNMFSFPWAKMTGGILYEHSHRLIGSLVGLLTLGLAILLWAAGSRPWVAWLGVVALAGVLVQGILVGLRVVLLADQLAFVHGIFAHTFLGLMASLALFTSRAWNDPAPSLPAEVAGRLRGLCPYATAGISVQIVLGAIVTHTGRRVDAHVGLAVVLSVLVPLLTQRVFVRLADWPQLTRLASSLRAAWIVQLILGLGSYVARFHGLDVPMAPLFALALPVLHRLAAGWMLIAALLLSLQVFRLSRPVGSAIVADDIPGKAAA